METMNLQDRIHGFHGGVNIGAFSSFARSHRHSMRYTLLDEHHDCKLKNGDRNQNQNRKHENGFQGQNTSPFL